MKQIDARPEDYRTKNARGRWVENIDRRFCRRGGLIGFAAVAMFAWSFWSTGDQSPAFPSLLFGYVMGLSSGALFTMSFFPTAR